MLQERRKKDLQRSLTCLQYIGDVQGPTDDQGPKMEAA